MHHLEAAQNPARQTHANTRNTSHVRGSTPVFQHAAGGCDVLKAGQRSRQESNTPTNCPEKRGVADMGGAESGALSSDSATKQHGSIDLPGLSDVPDVAKIWGTLPANVQADILALLRSANKPKS